MGAYLGPLSNLVELTQWAENQSVKTGQDPSFFTGLDGSRTAFVQPRVGRSLREWDVSMSKARPTHVAAFLALCLGAYGNGPFVFCDPLAQVTNVLTPRQSLCDPGTFSQATAAPALLAVPGLGDMPAILGISGVQRVGAFTPVQPGRAVTVSAWVSSDGPVTLTAACMNAAGALTNRGEVTDKGLVRRRRVSATVVPASNARAVDLRVTSDSPVTIACPAISWTSSMMPWSPGRGASQVVVHSLQEQIEQASPSDERRQRVSYSATVTEVGAGA